MGDEEKFQFDIDSEDTQSIKKVVTGINKESKRTSMVDGQKGFPYQNHQQIVFKTDISAMPINEEPEKMQPSDIPSERKLVEEDINKKIEELGPGPQQNAIDQLRESLVEPPPEGLNQQQTEEVAEVEVIPDNKSPRSEHKSEQQQ